MTSTGDVQDSWYVATTDPRSGSYHLATYPYDPDGVSPGVPNWNSNVRMWTPGCSEGAGFLAFWGNAARVNPGDFVRLGMYVKTAVAGWWLDFDISVTTTNYFTSVYDVNLHDQPFVTSGWTYWEHSFFVPTDGYWLVVGIDQVTQSPVDATAPPTGTAIYLDDFVLEIS